jgi:curved DNA-binding protein CbpA
MPSARLRATPLPGAIVQYTHYDYLELAPGASRAAIDAAYARRLEQLGYGTRGAGNDHAALLRCVHQAYEVLADPIARKSYDARLAQEAALADAELKALLDSVALKPQRSVVDMAMAANADAELAA